MPAPGRSNLDDPRAIEDNRCGRTRPIPAFQTIKARRDFLAVRGGQRASMSAFLLEAKPRSAERTAERGLGPEARFGFTITKKLGNAVRRNRIRRRLKAALAEVADSKAQNGFDYVIVARSPAFDRPFADLVADMTAALTRVHAPAGAKGRKTAPSTVRETGKKPAT